MLNVCGLTKKYGKTVAIEDISFSVETGEIVGLIGHNGCGKSTTMNIITGYLAASEGQVFIDGEDHVSRADVVRRKIGYLPETPPLYPEMTVEEQLLFACGLKGIKDKKEAIRLALKQADIQGVSGRLLKNLSKGYRQRIGLAQAFLGEPSLLILDEPSSGLDPYQNAEMRDILKEAAKKQAIVLSSHVLSEIETTCSRIVVLSNGRVVADDTPFNLQYNFRPSKRYYVVVQGCKEHFKTMVQQIKQISDLWIEDDQVAEGFRAEFSMEQGNPGIVMIEVIEKIKGTLIQYGSVLPDLENVYFELTRDRRYEMGEGRK